MLHQHVTRIQLPLDDPPLAALVEFGDVLGRDDNSPKYRSKPWILMRRSSARGWSPRDSPAPSGCTNPGVPLPARPRPPLPRAPRPARVAGLRPPAGLRAARPVLSPPVGSAARHLGRGVTGPLTAAASAGGLVTLDAATLRTAGAASRARPWQPSPWFAGSCTTWSLTANPPDTYAARLVENPHPLKQKTPHQVKTEQHHRHREDDENHDHRTANQLLLREGQETLFISASTAIRKSAKRGMFTNR